MHLVKTRRGSLLPILLLAASLGLACASAVNVTDAPVDEEAWPAPAAESGSSPASTPSGSTSAARRAAREPGWSELMKEGRGHLARGELADAEDRFIRAFDQTAGFRDDDPRTLATLNNLERLADAYRAAGDAASFARVLELLEFASETNAYARSAELAGLMQDLASTRALQGRHEDARAALERTAALLESLYGPDDPSLVGVHAQLGLTLIELGDLDAAEQEIDRAAEIGEAAAGRDSALFARSLLPRARLAVARDQNAEARAALQAAVDIHVAQDGESSPATARMVRELALFEQAIGNDAAAQVSFDRVISIWDQIPSEHYQRAQSRNELAWYLVEIGEPERAESPARSAMLILEEQGIHGQPLAAVADTLATALRDQGKYDQAETFYQIALEEGASGERLPGWNLTEIAERYAVLLDLTGRAAEADALRARWEAPSAPSTPVSDS